MNPKPKLTHRLYSNEGEAGALGCALLSPGECIPEIIRAGGWKLFYDLRHAALFECMEAMHRRAEVVDTITLHQNLKAQKRLKEVGGIEYLSTLPNLVPSAVNLPYYLDILRRQYAARGLQETCESTMAKLSAKEDGIADLIAGAQANLDTIARVSQPARQRPALKLWNQTTLAAYVPPAKYCLVGDNEITMGYEGLCVLAGPGSSGKSLAVVSLAMAGAIGAGYWMGRKIHRQFKTLIIQAENGCVRLKMEFGTWTKNHPVNVTEFIEISEPPEGGLPFHRAEFRESVRDAIARFKPDLVILDPWSQIATEDAAKDVIDKLGEIRCCFPAGDDCPGLVIVAHTKKPRPEDVRKGRGLVYMVSGSVALPNSARSVYVLLPWSDDQDDPRIYWSCSKLNNGEMYGPSVWLRKFGTFFEHDDTTNPQDWGKSEDSRAAITPEHLRSAFGKDVELRTGDMVKRLVKLAQCGESTAARAIGEDGYLRPMLRKLRGGCYRLAEEGGKD
jgi:replicative DNA helicase